MWRRLSSLPCRESRLNSWGRGDATFLRLQLRIDAVQRSYRLALLQSLQSQPEPSPIEMPLAAPPVGCPRDAAARSASAAS